MAAAVSAQRIAGTVRLQAKDATGAAVDASGVLRSHATGVRRSFQTDAQGVHEFRGLPFGPYLLQVEKPGFSTVNIAIEIRSEVPIEQKVILGVAPFETAVLVREADTLTDPRSYSATRYLGPDVVDYRASSAPGRSVVDLVNSQPGWLLEANGSLHPRGSEYDVQFVIDGIPLYDNRSPAFAQSLGIDEFESMNVRTAGYPAEFGRKLGGVVEVTSQHDPAPGLHGRMSLQGGSFAQSSGFASLQYSKGPNSFSVSGEGVLTDRYLDPPVLENFTNHGSGGGASARFDRTWSPSDSTRFYLSNRHAGFLVPNELLQQTAGQRQDRTVDETLGHVSHTHLFSPHVLSQLRLMVRDTSARLWSNKQSTPILPAQDRGFREAYLGGSVSFNKGSHELKAGGEALFTSIHEAFSYHIVTRRIGGVRIFDGGLPADFRFTQQRGGRDQSAFVQDLWRHGNFSFSAGVRFDHYKLVQDETAWSPRLGAAYSIPSLGLVLRSSYDRIFQAPAIENVLLASTNLVASLGGQGTFLPLRPSRGNFFEAGFSKSVFGKLRLDGTWYRRKLDNFADDSLLLNSGVSFPIAFAEAEIHGYEAKLEVPAWGAFSGFVSFSNMLGKGRLPIAGGLLLGDDASVLTSSKDSFPITQDQRNTLRSRIRIQPHHRLWFALGGLYNSGLPFEIDGPSGIAFLTAQYSPKILSKVNFARGRVRPSASLNSSVGLELIHKDRAKLTLQADVFNMGDRLNLINFSGLLSGTALEAGRSFTIRINAGW